MLKPDRVAERRRERVPQLTKKLFAIVTCWQMKTGRSNLTPGQAWGSGVVGQHETNSMAGLFDFVLFCLIDFFVCFVDRRQGSGWERERVSQDTGIE